MAKLNDLCMNCMSDLHGKDVCPVCGFQKAKPQKKEALPYGTMLQNRYLIGRAKKLNGEGITYIGMDTALNIPAEIHEYFPMSLSERAEDGKAVHVLGGSEATFQENKVSFLNYSRALAHMRELSAIVLIYDIFEENNVAYTVSEWDDSISLRYFVKRSGGNIGWNAARQLFMPVLSALSMLHADGISHFGISPDTLKIMKNGKMKLGSFSIAAVRQMDTDLPPDLVPGCAAVEQYIMGDTLTEATDVYGFAASMFFALTGILPPEAPRRRNDARLMIPNSIMRGLPPYVVSSLANALQVSPEKRTPTFERLRTELSAAPAITAAIEASQKFSSVHSAQPDSEKKPAGKKKETPGFVWVLSSCLVMLAVFTVIGYFWLNWFGNDSQPSDAHVASSSMVSSEDSSSTVSMVQSESDADKITVPNLVGQKYDDLKAAAASGTGQQYQLLLSKPQFSDTIPEGFVASQDPKPGSKIAQGSAIVIVVSQGPAVRTLPAVEGLTLSQASAAVTSAGFVPTKIEQYSSVPKGTVIGYKNVKAGSQMAYGSSVVLIVSLGPSASS
jgi:serine/threonine-protein kinase